MNIRKPKATMAIRISPIAYDMVRSEAERNNLNIADAVDHILKIDNLKEKAQKETKAEDSTRVELDQTKIELEQMRKEHETMRKEYETMKKEYEEAKKEADKWVKSTKRR